MRDWAASNRSDRDCCLFIYFYSHLTSSTVQSPSLYNALSPRRHLSLPPALHGQSLAHSTLTFCSHSCLLAGSLGEWYVWSPEGTEWASVACESWQSLRSPRGRGESTERDHEGGREAGAEGSWGWGAGVCVCAEIQCTNSRTLWAQPMLLVSVWLLDSSQLP